MSGYTAESVLTRADASDRLDLATALGATPSGLVESPTFFTGFVDRPDVTAAGILAVADVAASRYADVGVMQRLASLDPVVTAGGDRLRFESFSACNGVHARFDLLPEGLGSSEVGFGTTNVDVNQPLRTALARVDRAVPLHLSVGPDELRASSPDSTHVERKVTLPDRWVRGLAEVPSLMARMTAAGSLGGAAVGRFLASLPRVQPPGPSVHVIPLAGGWRTTSRPVQGSFPLVGVSRLRGCERILRHASHLTVHVAPNGTTAWVFHLPGSRFTLAMSPDPFRGFSGEGTLLALLSRSDAESVGRVVLGELGWGDRGCRGDRLGHRAGRPVRGGGAGVGRGVGAPRLRPDRRCVVPPRAPGRRRQGTATQPAAGVGEEARGRRQRPARTDRHVLAGAREPRVRVRRHAGGGRAEVHVRLGARARDAAGTVQARPGRPHRPAGVRCRPPGGIG